MLRLLLVLTMLAAFGAVGCGDDDDGGNESPTEAQTGDGTPEAAYLIAYDEIHSDILVRIEENSAAYPRAFDGDLEQTQASFPVYLALFDEHIERVDALEAPDSLRELHDELQSLDKATSLIHHKRAELLAEATTYAEVDAIYAEDAEFTRLYEDSLEACQRRLILAEAHDVDIGGCSES